MNMEALWKKRLRPVGPAFSDRKKIQGAPSLRPLQGWDEQLPAPMPLDLSATACAQNVFHRLNLINVTNNLYQE